jgi:ribosome-associated translation inhibitor RaiA
MTKTDRAEKSSRAAKEDPFWSVVVFRDLKPSTAIEDRIRKHAQKLNRIHHRILSCKTIVEGSHGHHRKGPLYRVHVELNVPGRRLNARSAGRHEHAHDDVYAAIRDAFAAVERQLQDRVHRASGKLSQEQRSSSLRSARLT